MKTIKRNGYEFQVSTENPFYRFKGGGKPKLPPPPPPAALPDETPESEEWARKKRPRGRQETFITGDLIPTETNKKKVLG